MSLFWLIYVDDRFTQLDFLDRTPEIKTQKWSFVYDSWLGEGLSSLKRDRWLLGFFKVVGCALCFSVEWINIFAL